jgi:hypothetical protein
VGPLVMLDCKCWEEMSYSCIAGKFLQYRKCTGRILVLQVNTLFLE